MSGVYVEVREFYDVPDPVGPGADLGRVAVDEYVDEGLVVGLIIFVIESIVNYF